MQRIRNLGEKPLAYLRAFALWFVLSAAVGAVTGAVGTGFHIGIDFAQRVREASPFFLYLLPVAGVLIVLVYKLLKVNTNVGTSRVIEALQGENTVPGALAPAISVGTFLTHLCGGSAGREGAALQLGGSIGAVAARCVRAGKQDARLLIMCGMSGLFSALFGTPVAAALFVLEVSYVGEMPYAALLPCLVSSLSAFLVSTALGVAPVRFALSAAPAITALSLAQALLLGAACAGVSIAFCVALNRAEKQLEKRLPNEMLRAALGGVAVIALTLMFGTHDYNGAGMDVVARALTGDAVPYAFAAKLLFTVVTIAAGFRGGEIVPTFFIGATLGATCAPLIGMDAGLGAAIGMIALFCGMVNCPVTALALGVEIFGADCLPLMASACAASFMLSGNYGLYSAQSFLYSKIKPEYTRGKTSM